MQPKYTTEICNRNIQCFILLHLAHGGLTTKEFRILDTEISQINNDPKIKIMHPFDAPLKNESK